MVRKWKLVSEKPVCDRRWVWIWSCGSLKLTSQRPSLILSAISSGESQISSSHIMLQYLFSMNQSFHPNKNEFSQTPLQSNKTSPSQLLAKEISKCPCQKKKGGIYVQKLVNLELRSSTKQFKTCTRIKKSLIQSFKNNEIFPKENFDFLTVEKY